MSAPVDCQHAFPLPTYQTISDSLPSEKDWDRRFQNQNKLYGSASSSSNSTHQNKVAKCIWRGSLSNNLGPDGDYQQMTRWRLARLSYEQAQLHGNESVLDAGLVWIPNKHRNIGPLNLTVIGGLKKAIKPMTEFQRYVGIIDVDGNSWSSRFGTLLCYNSVVLKVDPEHVDLFMRDLVPGKHYIPIQRDLSDLVAKARFVVDPKNQQYIHRIQQQAHQYCREHMVWRSLAQDVLDVFEEYLRNLELGDPNWQEAWSIIKQDLVANHDFGLRQVQIQFEEAKHDRRG
jgi:hypothetical protein